MQSHLLLTGSTGTIGRLLLPRLLSADPSRRISVLVRDAEKAVKNSRVSAIQGDLRLSQLGLDRATWLSLTDTVTDVIHCGADIRFTRTIGESRAVNTAGTKTMLDLARQSNCLKRFIYVSTTYVIGRDCGDLAEREYQNLDGFVNTYEQAKYEAEQAVFASMSDVPAAVIRLSSVAGAQTSYLRQILRLIPQNPFPFIPGIADARVDLISEEWTAAALSQLFENHFRPGSVHHVCAGPTGSIPVLELVKLAHGAMGVMKLPTLVPLEEFERFTAKLLRRGTREPIKAMLRSVSSFLPHLAIRQTFQNALTLAMLKGSLKAPCSRDVAVAMVTQLTGNSARVAIPTGQAYG